MNQENTPKEISAKTLADMDQSIRNFKLGKVSDPVDLSDLNDKNCN